MSNRRILVTGGGQGIGFAVAKAFLREGDSVAIIGRNRRKLEAARERLAGIGDRVNILTADVTKPEGVEGLIVEVKSSLGGLEVLVNNVGEFAFASTLRHSWEKWERVVHSNMSSVFLMCKVAAPLLRESGSGRIINIAAAYASMQKGFTKYGPYAAAKAGAISLTKSLAAELAAWRITVNAVSPGLIDTGAYDSATMER